MTEVCKRCGSKDLTMQSVVGGVQVSLCAKCTQKWWDLRNKVVIESFEDFIKDA